MNLLFSFHVMLFFFGLLLLLVCAMERWESGMLSGNRTCLLHGDLYKNSVVSLRSVPISGVCGQFLCYESVSECQEPMREIYHQKGKKKTKSRFSPSNWLIWIKRIKYPRIKGILVPVCSSFKFFLFGVTSPKLARRRRRRRLLQQQPSFNKREHNNTT